MRNIKTFHTFKSKQEIKQICTKYGIKEYEVNDDMSVDVDGGIDLSGKLSSLQKLPLSFNKAVYFDCDDNNLVKLDGSPTEVRGGFYCSNNKLTSLQGGPRKASEVYFMNNPIQSLYGLGNSVIDKELNVSNCSKLYSLDGFPKRVKEFICKGTPIEAIYNKYIKDTKNVNLFNRYNIITTDDVLWNIDFYQLAKFTEKCNLPKPNREDLEVLISNTKYRIY
jgi:hypothetical protein